MTGNPSASTAAATGGGKTETVARKFLVAFLAMFVIPMLATLYLLSQYAKFTSADTMWLVLMAGSAALLGVAGYFVCRSVARSLLDAARNAQAIAGGDMSLRLETGTAGEISELARNFNRITARLQTTIDSLETSRKQILLLLSQVCDASGTQTVDLPAMLDVFLGTLLSLTGLDVGAIFLFASDRCSLSVAAAKGFGEDLGATVVPAGKGIVGWVAERGQIVTTSESMPWGNPDGLTAIEKSMPWAIHVPIGTAGAINGAMSIGLRSGRKEVPPEELLMIRNLAAQMAVAIENSDLKVEMERIYVETVAALATAVEARDKYTRGHSKRVTGYAVEIARKLGTPDAFVKDLEAASLLHDIGKIGMPDFILHNTAKILPAKGADFILAHPVGGENILKPVGSLARLCPIVRHHHEHFDGTGYPDRLKGEQIPLAARILAVADSFDAMTSDRAYRDQWTREQAMAELERCRGSHFDPACVDAFLGCLNEPPAEGEACSS